MAPAKRRVSPARALPNLGRFGPPHPGWARSRNQGRGRVSIAMARGAVGGARSPSVERRGGAAARPGDAELGAAALFPRRAGSAKGPAGCPAGRRGPTALPGAAPPELRAGRPGACGELFMSTDEARGGPGDAPQRSAGREEPAAGPASCRSVGSSKTSSALWRWRRASAAHGRPVSTARGRPGAETDDPAVLR